MSEDDASVQGADKPSAPPAAFSKQSNSKHGRTGVVPSRRNSKVQETGESNRQSFTKKRRGEEGGSSRRVRSTSARLQAGHVPVAAEQTDSPDRGCSTSWLRDVRENGPPDSSWGLSGHATANVITALDGASASPGKEVSTSAHIRQSSSLLLQDVETNLSKSRLYSYPRSSGNEDSPERFTHKRDPSRASNMRPFATQRMKDTPEAESAGPSRQASRSMAKSESDSEWQHDEEHDSRNKWDKREDKLEHKGEQKAGRKDHDNHKGEEDEKGYGHRDEGLRMGEHEEVEGKEAPRSVDNYGGSFGLLPSQEAGRGSVEAEKGTERKNPSAPSVVHSNADTSSVLSLSVVTKQSGGTSETSPGHGDEGEGHDRQTSVKVMMQSEESEEIGEVKERSPLDLRKHSSSNLVSLRRSFAPRQSLELFEEDETDDSSEASDGSGPREQDASKIAELPAKQSAKSANKNPFSLNLSQEGISGISAAAKATVKINTTSSKYLKLFSPSNSAHQSHGVLATIHREMNGTGWPRRGGWDSYLVRKSQAELDDGRVYGVKAKEGSVELLVLSSNNVCGRIPVEIARLSSLKCLDLSNNHISGPIPAELGLLLQLQTLQLQGNNLRDEISPLLGSIINLVRLSLGHNKLSGAIPDSLGNLVQLKFLSLEHNRLTGQIPSFVCRLPVLENLNASSNQLGGVIPEGIGSLSMLKKLDFSDNLLEGTIPGSLCMLRLLNWLRLDSNQLEGEVPSQFSSLKNLLILNLNSNAFSGPMPAALGLCPDIMTAHLRGNSFHGPCPFPVAQASSKSSGIRKLDLGCNDLEEPLPDLTGLRDLQTLAMDNNRFYGGLGEGLTNACPSLSKLHLQSNRLTGEIPDSLGTLTKLEDLDLSDNCFEGYLPSGLQSLHLLRAFSASNNELSGELPSFLGSLTELTRLALNGNNFEGTIPRELGKLTSLEGLYLEKNQLVGSIPADLSKCVSLRELYLHENKMWGKIPDSLRKLVELRYLYLYKNRLTGTVPEWLAELQHLQGLILGENRLRGTIPWQLGHLHKLEDLYLNDNHLEGGIPERLIVNCERLQRLVVAGNHLTGRVPRSLASVQDLRELNIERNNMHGELPIPLFLKTSLGPQACGLKFCGNPRIIDSRGHFASTVAGIRRAEARSASPAVTSGPKERLRRRKALLLAFRSVVRTLPASRGAQRPRDSSFVSEASQRTHPGEMSKGLSNVGGSEHVPQPGPGSLVSHGETAADVVRLSGDSFSERDVEEGREEDSTLSTDGDDSGGLARPWVSSEDVFYFLLKAVVGNALVVLDFMVAVRLHHTGCMWGAVCIVVWKAMAALEGVAATRRLGYGIGWQSLAAIGLALPLESRRCFYHSCESDLFHALQKVEWRWHAMIQFVTQFAAALACWDYAFPGLIIFWVSVATKGLVVGVVSMQRLDDQRLLRAWGNTAPHQHVSLVNPTWSSNLKANFLPWVQASAWPRLILVGFHIAELTERTIPLSVLIASLGRWAFLAPLAMVPGMLVRYVARRGRRVPEAGGVSPALKKALGMSLALDSSFGAGTPTHFVALIATTVETVAFNSFAAGNPRAYPSSLGDAILSWCSAMLIFTWLVFLLEKLVPLGAGPPRLLSPPLLTPPSKPCSPTVLAQGPPSSAPRASGSRLPVVDSSVDRGKCGATGAQGGRTGMVVPSEK